MARRLDPLSPSERSERMGLVRATDTEPEMIVRRLVHGMGYRYRLHRRDLPGKPDIVFSAKGKIIFVHGCFWHRHGRCKLTRLPKSRVDFWHQKLEGNHARDVRIHRRLRGLGWDILVIWECQLRNIDALTARIREFLG